MQTVRRLRDHLSWHRSATPPSVAGPLFSEHAEPLLLFFCERTCDPEVALALCAETLACAVERHDAPGGPDSDELRDWLYGIAYRRLARYGRAGAPDLRALRRVGITVPELAPEERALIEQRAGMAGIRAAIRERLGGLEPRERDALRLVALESCDAADAARRLAVSESELRMRAASGLRTLRGELPLDPPEGPEPSPRELPALTALRIELARASVAA